MDFDDAVFGFFVFRFFDFGFCVFFSVFDMQICTEIESVPNSSNLLGKHHEMSLRLIYNLKERNRLVDKFTNYTNVWPGWLAGWLRCVVCGMLHVACGGSVAS